MRYEIDDDSMDSVKEKLEQLSYQPLKFKNRTIYQSTKLTKKKRSSTYVRVKNHDSFTSLSEHDSAEIIEPEYDIIDMNRRTNIMSSNNYFNQTIMNFNQIKALRKFPIIEKKQEIREKKISLNSLKLIEQSPQQEDSSKYNVILSPPNNEKFQNIINMHVNFTSSQNNNSRFSIYQQQQSSQSSYTIDIPLLNQESISLNSQKRLQKFTDKQILDQIIELIFHKNIQQLNQLLIQMNREYRNDIINQTDHNGNTPLFLAIKLGYQSNYFEIIRLLLAFGSDPTIKDLESWSPIEEAVAQLDIVTTSLLFDYLVRKKEIDLQQERAQIDQQLINIDDFYIEMKWEFQSNIIPFLSKIAPSDVFKIYKRSTSLRLDSTFVGAKNFKAKRRDMSVLYNPLNGRQQRKENQSNCKFVVMLNRTKNIYFYPMQEIDPEEKKLILIDLLNCDSVSGQMKIIDTRINRSKSIFGGYVQTQVGQYQCQKYDFKVKTEQCFNKKRHVPLLLNFEQYSNYQGEFRQQTSSRINVNDSYASKLIFDNFSSVHKSGTMQSIETRKQSKNCQLFVTQNFPLRFQQFLPVIKMLAKGNQFMQSMIQILETNQIKDLIFQNGFPVKVQIPISFSIDAVITFQAYRKLDLEDENLIRLFEIPPTLQYSQRKEAQKLLLREKKRLLLANLYL